MCSGRVDPAVRPGRLRQGRGRRAHRRLPPRRLPLRGGQLQDASAASSCCERMLARHGHRGGALPPRVDLRLRRRQGEDGRQRHGGKSPGARAARPARARLRNGTARWTSRTSHAARQTSPKEVDTMPDKPKVAFYWCASCGGCEEVRGGPGRGHPGRGRDRGHRLLAGGHGLQDEGRRGDARRVHPGHACSTAPSAPPSRRRWPACSAARANLVIAYGSCATLGGIPGLANQFDREQILSLSTRSAPPR